MNDKKDFADDIGALSKSVDDDVARVVTLLKGDQETPTRPTSRKSRSRRRDRSNADESSALASQRPKGARHRQQITSASTSAVFQNVTTRLPADMNDLLTEAALRQKLKKQAGIACTRQSIILEALQEWMCKHGYST